VIIGDSDDDQPKAPHEEEEHDSDNEEEEHDSDNDPSEWYYLDRNGDEWGPFNTMTMRGWYTQGIVDADLMMRLKSWTAHRPLRDLLEKLTKEQLAVELKAWQLSEKHDSDNDQVVVPTAPLEEEELEATQIELYPFQVWVLASVVSSQRFHAQRPSLCSSIAEPSMRAAVLGIARKSNSKRQDPRERHRHRRDVLRPSTN